MKIGITGASVLLTSMIASAQGKEPERGIVITDKPVNHNPPTPVVSIFSKTAVSGDNTGWTQRQTKNRKHIQIGSYKFKSKSKKC